MRKLLISLIALTASMAAPSLAQFSLELGAGFYTGWSGNLSLGLERIGGSPLGMRLGLHGAVGQLVNDDAPYDSTMTWGEYKRSVRESGGMGTDYAFSMGAEADLLWALVTPELPLQVSPYVGLRFNWYGGEVVANGSHATSMGRAGPGQTPALGYGAGFLLDYLVSGVLFVRTDIGLDFYPDNCIYSEGAPAYPVCPGDPDYERYRRAINAPGYALKARVSAVLKF